jgi:hypothetical protein
LKVENTRITANFCTGSVAAGGDGGEGEAVVELVHGVMEVLEGRLAQVFATASPMLVDAHDAAAQDA